MINCFYNITSKDENLNFYTDVLTGIRKDYYINKEKQKGKITQNSSADSIYYEFSLESDRPFKWRVSDDVHIFSDTKSLLEDGKYCVSYYTTLGLVKQITFSKFHTLLKVEYFNMTKSTSPYFVIEPRKSSNGLCLLINEVGSYQSIVLVPMPRIEDEYIFDKIESEFTDYSAIASTNEGIVKFLDTKQLEEFEKFVDRAQALKLTDTAPTSYIDKEDAVLANKLNPKDFNVKRNLSEIVNIADAEEFSYDSNDDFEIKNEPVQGFVEFTAEDLSEEILDSVDTTDDYIAETLAEDEYQDSSEELDALKDVIEVVEDIVEEPDALELVDLAIDETAEEIVTADNAEVIEESSEELIEELFEEVSEIEEEPESEVVLESEVEAQPAEIIDEFTMGEDIDPSAVIENGKTKYFYYGQLDSDNKRTGFGRTTSEDGKTAYEGYYENNKREGVGAYYYKNGELCYYGNWCDNKRDGFGIGVSSFDKSVHIGKFKDNKPFGDGVRVDENGDIRFVKRILSNGVTVELGFDGDKIIVKKYNTDGEIISENTSNLIYF